VPDLRALKQAGGLLYIYSLSGTRRIFENNVRMSIFIERKTLTKQLGISRTTLTRHIKRWLKNEPPPGLTARPYWLRIETIVKLHYFTRTHDLRIFQCP
jgi:hypothetical protein